MDRLRLDAERVAAPALGAAAAALSARRRDALGRFLRHLSRGERIAERIARRQAALAPDARAARFLASQARQESMHAVVLAAAFDAVGGFPVQQIEDVAICQRLRALAPPAFLPLAVTTSSRKFERMGVWRSFGRVLAILICLRLGRRPPQAFFADIR